MKAKPSSISNQIHLKIAFVHPSLEEEKQDTQVKRRSRPKWRQFFLSFFPSLSPRLESLKLCWKLNGINHEQGNQGRFISAEKRCQILNAFVAVVRNFITVLVRKKGSQKWKLLKETGELMSTSGIIIGFGIISISEPAGRGANGCAVAMEMMV